VPAGERDVEDVRRRVSDLVAMLAERVLAARTPAEPPNRCVTTVPNKINGAIRRGTPPPGVWIWSRMRLLPPSTDRPIQ